MNEFKKLFNVICIVGISSCFIYSCDSQSNGSNFFDKTIKSSDIDIDENQNILYNGKPFTGTVETEVGNWKTKVEDGIPLYDEKSYQNGYRMKEYIPDRTKEYYDYNGNRISAKEFYDGIAR